LLPETGSTNGQTPLSAFLERKSGLSAPDPLLFPTGENLRSKGVSGSLIMGATQAMRLVLQIASVVLLARLLEPEHFGLFAMATPIVALAMLVGDLGINQALITAKTIRQSEASTLFWCNIAIATTMAMLLVLAGPLIAAFYDEAELAPLVVALSLSVAFAGLSSQHIALLSRGLRFGTIALIEVAAAMLGFAAALSWALTEPGPFALVISMIVTTLVTAIGAWLATRWVPSRPGPVSEVTTMLRFGTGVTGFNLANFVARNADDIIIGRAAGAAVLGAYDRAYKLLLMPLEQVSRPIGRVVLPILSQLRDEPDRYRAAYLRTVRQIMLITLPGVVFLLMEAERLVPLLLGEGWGQAVAIFKWLAIASLHQPLTTTIGWLFMSQGRSDEFAFWGLVNGLVLLAAFLIGITFIGGAVGVAQAYALTDAFLLAPVLYAFVGRKGPVKATDLYGVALQHVVAGAAAALAVFLWGSRDLQPGALHDVLHLVGAAALAYLASTLAIALFPQGRRSLAESLSLARGVLT